MALGPGQLARVGAGGHHHPVGLEHPGVVEDEAAGPGVERHRPVAEHELGPQLVHLLVVGQDGPLGRPGAGQHLLGEGRAVVGEVELLADEDQAPPEALGPQGLGGPKPGQRGTDDDDGVVVAERVRRRRPRGRRAAHRPNMASHSRALRGRKTKLVRRVSPMEAEGSAE